MDNTAAMESPLDVLSRAATMIQQNADRKPRDHVVCKELSSSARWRRERRPCPLLARPRTEPRTLPPTTNCSNEMAPLDMSTRRKPTSNNDNKISPARANHSSALRVSTNHKSGYKQMSANERVTVITCATPISHSSGSSAEEENESDTVIDEHFRRSLGRDYLALFPTPVTSSNPSSDRKSPTSLAERAPASNSTQLTGLSVDDHFAKALGETWLRLQAGEKSEDNKAKVSSSTETVAPDSTRKSPPSSSLAPLKVST